MSDKVKEGFDLVFRKGKDGTDEELVAARERVRIYAGLGPDDQPEFGHLKPVVGTLRVPGAELVVAFMDATDRIAFGITKTGKIYAPGMAVGEVTSSLAVQGYQLVFGIQDANNRVAFGIAADGTVYAPGLTSALLTDGSVTPPKLALAAVTGEKVAEDTLPLSKLVYDARRVIADDFRSAMPDDVRPQLQTIGVKTQNHWVKLAARPTPILWGVNNSGQSLDFRKASGLLVRGRRYVNAYDPGPVPSVTYRGTFVTAVSWPPAGTFAAGDFYEQAEPSGANITIGPDTVRRGDLMVYNGSAWVLQRAPGSGVTRVFRDWYSVSAAGSFNGISLTTSDRLVFFTTQPAGGGPVRTRFVKGAPETGEFFHRGQWDPASGLPASPVDGDVYEVSATGTTGGFSVMMNDMLMRSGGQWAVIPTSPVRTFAAGALVALSDMRDASEWEVRRSDKSATSVGITLNGRGGRPFVRSKSPLLILGDSMPGKLNQSLIAAMAPRQVTTLTYGGGKSQEAELMYEFNILTAADIHRGSTLLSWQGENNASDLAQIAENADRVAGLAFASDGRVVHLTMPGRRDMTWNGTRLVCANQEQQLIASSNNSYAVALRYFQQSWAEQYIDTRQVLAAGAGSTPDLQFPGMTELQVAQAYGIVPLSFFYDFAAVSWLPQNLVFKGYWSTSGLPAGGAANDYYLRTGGTGTIGAIIVNVAGVWAETSYDSIHLNSASPAPGNVVLAAAVKSFLTAKGW